MHDDNTSAVVIGGSDAECGLLSRLLNELGTSLPVVSVGDVDVHARSRARLLILGADAAASPHGRRLLEAAEALPMVTLPAGAPACRRSLEALLADWAAPAAVPNANAGDAKPPVHALPDPVLIADATGIVRYANLAAVRYFAPTEGFLLREPLPFQPIAGEFQEVSVFRDGRRRHCECHTAEIQWNGGPAFAITARDITARKAAEERILVQNHRLEATRFEMQTAFDELGQVYRETCQAVHSQAGDLVESVGREAIALDSHTALRQCETLQNLAADALRFLHASCAVLRHEDVHLDRCLDNALAVVIDELARLRVRVHRDSLPEVKGDAGLLETLLLTVVEHALEEHTSPQAQLAIGCDAQGPNPVIRISVQAAESAHAALSSGDAGNVGTLPLEARVRPRIRSTICRNIVARHGGRFWHEHTAEGVVYRFALGDPSMPSPLTKTRPFPLVPRTSPTKQASGDGPPRRPLVVIVADEQPGGLAEVQRLFDALPDGTARMLGFGNIAEALLAASRRPADVLVFDASPKSMDVTTAIDQLRASGDTRALLVFARDGDERAAAEVIKRGADDYLVSDGITAEVLHHAIANAVRQRQSREQRKALEQQVIAAQKMESVGTLAGGIAHDFNNLLSGMMGILELTLLRSTEPKARRDLQRVYDTCGRMADLIRRLLAFSRGGRDQRPFEVFDLQALLENVGVMIRHSAPPGVSMALKLPEEPLLLNRHQAMCEQVFLNLCMNAVEAMGDHGRLEVEAQRIRIDEDLLMAEAAMNYGDYIVVSVRDNGPGIAPERVDRIFEPFFTTKKGSAKKGTGLGLAVVWQNVHDLGGMVKVNSDVGRGTTFRVFLPAAASSSPKSIVHPGPLPEGSESILLVDDETIVRESAGPLLERLGYRVHYAVDGFDALAVFGQARPEIALIILDIAMPRMNGTECFRRLRELEPAARVLFATAHSVDWEEAELVQRGARGVIQKPYQLHDLARRVRAALDE